VCNLNDDAAATDADACAKAVAALHKCVQARSTQYDGYARDADSCNHYGSEEIRRRLSAVGLARNAVGVPIRRRLPSA
jgi:hypothetical protein